ncbi:MAG: hypothetical protein EP346_13065 [Bacteroidetes bacterium]|nr:MAG: hypothetical protein EP346_13065 [Bacteroidota bacterium]
MKIYLLAVASLLFSATLSAQSVDPKDLENMKFRNVGPAGMSGRITTIDMDLLTNTLYVGSASGGLWESENFGQSWKPIFEHESTSSIGAVAVDPTNPDVIWVGTGEGNPRNSQSSGDGVFKSIDGGETWMHLGLEATKNIHRVIIDPTHPNTVYVAAIGVAWGDSEERGLYKTTDGGATWEKILYVNNRTGVADMVMDPQNPNKLIVAMWEYRRWPWELKSGGEGSGIYVTYDGGKNWTQRTDEDGLPKGNLGRCGLAISASDPNIVYSLVESTEKNALYRSEDGGRNWHKVSDGDEIGNRPFYYADIYVDPQRPDRIYSLWSVLTRSDDGGKSWRTIGPYSFIHPDHHAFWINPKNPDHVIDGNDGGLNISYDGGITWRFVDNLPLAQFYHINVDNEMPYHIYGGMQDNGSWMGPAYTYRAGGMRNDLWEELFFGDGFDVVPHPTDPTIAYAMAQEGYVTRIDLETGYNVFIRPVHPEQEELRFNWNAAIAQNPFNPSSIYFGSQYVHKSDDMGDSWTIISPDLTTNDTAFQKAKTSGGLTMDVTGAENYTTILAIEPSSVNEKVIWVSTDDGRLSITTDGGANWKSLEKKLKEMPKGAWIPQVVSSPTNAGEAYVVVNDYRRNNWTPYLYHTTDYGSSFTRVIDEEDVDGYVLSVMPDPVQPRLVFAGTENGLYVSFDAGENWQKWGEDLPTVPVADMAIQERDGDLVLGTFGRSAWVLDDIRPLRVLATEGNTVGDDPLTAFQAPDAFRVVNRQALGIRFAGSTVYSGENRTDNARFSYWVNVDSTDEAFSKNERIKWDIVDANGDTIRHIEREYTDGLNRVSWDMMEKGVRAPSMSDPNPKQEHSDPGSIPVLPGMYTVHLRIADYTSNVQIKVDQDPRLNLSREDLEENYAFMKESMPYVEAVSNLSSNLRDAKKSIALVQKIMEMQEDELGDSVVAEMKEKIKAVSDSLEVVRAAIFGPENAEGYIDESNTWTFKMGMLGYYKWMNRGRVAGNMRNAAALFESSSESVLAKGQSFFEQDWKAFETYIRERELPLFKPLEGMNIQE